MKWAIVLIVMSVFQQSSWADDRVSIDRLKHPGGSLAALGFTFPKRWPSWFVAEVANRLNLAIETRNEELLSPSEHEVLLGVLDVARARCQLLDPSLDIDQIRLEAKSLRMISMVDEDLPFVSSLISDLERTSIRLQEKDLRSRALSAVAFCAGVLGSFHFFSSPADWSCSLQTPETAMIPTAIGIGAGVMAYSLGSCCRTSDVDSFNTWMARPSLAFSELRCAGEKSNISEELIHQARVRGSLRSIGPDFIDVSEIGEVRCPICMEDYEIGKSVAINENCHHGFCIACWMRLFVMGPKPCPFCRHPARASDYQVRIISGPQEES